MDLSMFNWFAIALMFFLVTTSLAVGPLFVWRLFFGAEAGGQPHRRKLPLVSTLLGLGAVLFAFAAMLFSVRVSQEPSAREVAGIAFPAPRGTMSVAAERSLFESDLVHRESSPLPPRMTARPNGIAMLIPVLAVVAVLALVGTRLRESLIRLVPVILAAVLLGYLLLGTWRSQAVQREERSREATVAEQAAIVTKFQNQQTDRSVDQGAVRLEPVFVDGSVTDTNENKSVKGANTGKTTIEESQPTDNPMPVTEYVGTSMFGQPQEELPAWTQADDEDGSLRVIQSGKHATIQAAKRKALAQLQNLLRSEFVAKYPEAAGWVPPVEVILDSGSLQKRALEQSQIQVGDFVSPMYETYWQVDTAVEAPLFQAWRPTVVKSRLGWLGAGVGLLTLLFGSLAAFLRVDEQTGGKRRKALAVGTVAMWAAVGSALLFMA